jgi:uncharacterized protein
MNVLYLHGFASSPRSSKATYLTERFAEQGITVRTPDLNLPDFSTLTVSRMLQQTDEIIDGLPDGPVVLIGSSLGGFVAVHAAAARPDCVQKLVLLAPALDVSAERMDQLGDRPVAEWRRSGSLNVFHYGYGRTLPVQYALYEDAAYYNALQTDLHLPILVFQGRHDEAVDPATVEQWSSRRPNVELHLLDDDHQLGRSLSYIWMKLAAFLMLTSSPSLTSKSRDSLP